MSTVPTRRKSFKTCGYSRRQAATSIRSRCKADRTLHSGQTSSRSDKDNRVFYFGRRLTMYTWR
ncbi:hypothetical protein CY34DRAFT_809565 [Suillus luteus UH-Slu-Lm8-n1]|uniref:Uncharacterized protein n=1 Tax=Suillus luteus UH-Slu-Lm8-n1 TaxID=930992 RepID=A0A0D0AV39_9AGAM|nr:hypothetical protein CY34DRAFT_809565 [Suillus luteus UH-Slu-Lm8-n1]